jgi:hypothetical protein
MVEIPHRKIGAITNYGEGGDGKEFLYFYALRYFNGLFGN